MLTWSQRKAFAAGPEREGPANKVLAHVYERIRELAYVDQKLIKKHRPLSKQLDNQDM